MYNMFAVGLVLSNSTSVAGAGSLPGAASLPGAHPPRSFGDLIAVTRSCSLSMLLHKGQVHAWYSTEGLPTRPLGSVSPRNVTCEPPSDTKPLPGATAVSPGHERSTHTLRGDGAGEHKAL